MYVKYFILYWSISDWYILFFIIFHFLNYINLSRTVICQFFISLTNISMFTWAIHVCAGRSYISADSLWRLYISVIFNFVANVFCFILLNNLFLYDKKLISLYFYFFIVFLTLHFYFIFYFIFIFNFILPVFRSLLRHHLGFILYSEHYLQLLMYGFTYIRWIFFW